MKLDLESVSPNALGATAEYIVVCTSNRHMVEASSFRCRKLDPRRLNIGCVEPTNCCVGKTRADAIHEAAGREREE